VLLLGLTLVPWGPLAYLPAVLSWPLVAAALAGWWIAEARSSGCSLLPEINAGAVAEACCLMLIFGSFLLLKLVGLHPSGTDDNIYYYMALRMTEGSMPYRDFFFAHPPVHLLVPAAVFSLTGFSIGVAKAIPAVAQAVAGLFLYLTVRKAARPLALVALLLHLTAYEVLMGSTDMNGENIMTAFLLASLFAATRGWFALSGGLAGLGLGSGLYGLAGVLALAVAALSNSWRSLARFGTGLAATFGSVMIVFAVIGGDAFWNFRDPIFLKSVYFHAPLYIGFLTGAALPAGKALASWLRQAKSGEPWYACLRLRGMLSGSPEGLVTFCTIAVLLFMLQCAALSEIYDYYTVPLIVMLAVPAAYCLVRIWEGICDARRFSQALVPAVLAAAFCMHVPLAASLNRSLWPEEYRDAGKVVSYQWREPWALAKLSLITRALFFSDTRVKGSITPYYRHYVWNKMLTFSTVDALAEYIRASSAADETITGASILAPLVALQAGRRLAADEADTNSKRFSTGIVTIESFFEKCCSDRIRYIVSAERSLFDNEFMAGDPVVKKYFTRDREFLDPQLAHFRDTRITLYRRNDTPGLPDGKVCLSN
ncbi:MAG: glycosyltransferase family 39 protein, partial [Proteobacteria bacterium]|nr:glycosyltransferase family 39 protein [Pseudomonadota bacterium]